jgi:hypothetical protein
MHYGSFAGWQHLGGTDAAYNVPVTLGPPSLK